MFYTALSGTSPTLHIFYRLVSLNKSSICIVYMYMKTCLCVIL